jgi:hypothetical protein
MIFVILPFIAFALIAGGAIARMEYLRRRVVNTRGLTGVVASKRVIPEHGTSSGAAYFGASVPQNLVVPEAYAITVRNASGDREVIVDKDTFDNYNIGDEFGAPK